MAAMQLFAAVCRDHKEGNAPDAPVQKIDERQARAVGPLDVIQHKEPSLLGRDDSERRQNRLEQPHSPLCHLDRRQLLGLDLKLREQLREWAHAGTQALAPRIAVRTAEMIANGFNE